MTRGPRFDAAWPPATCIAHETRHTPLQLTRFATHVWQQRRGLWALARLASGIGRARDKKAEPGRVIEREVMGPSASLQRDFIRYCGGDPSHYRGVIPSHLVSQWSLPAMLEVAEQLPYPPLKVINTGVHVEFLAPLPIVDRLRLRTALTSVEETERAALLTIRVATLLPSGAEAVRTDLHLRVRTTNAAKGSRPGGRGQERKAPPSTVEGAIPAGVRELGRHRLRRDAGLEFSRLTGDYNPIHWSVRYARSTGLPGAILQGFASFALIYEALTRSLLSGEAARIAALDVRFTRPLTLPCSVGIFSRGAELYLGEAIGAPAYAEGTVALRGLAPESER